MGASILTCILQNLHEYFNSVWVIKLRKFLYNWSFINSTLKDQGFLEAVPKSATLAILICLLLFTPLLSKERI